MTEILQAPERKGIIISEQDIPFSAYQAIYHKLTKKVETLSRSYKDAYSLQVSDLKNLDQRLNQLVAQYQLNGSRCEISHATKNGFSRTHSSFEKFEFSDASARECTSSLSYQMDFLVVLPAQIAEAEDIPQRYKVEVIFEQDFFDEDDEKLPYFLRGFASLGSLRAKIEYTDFAVAQSIDATISGWVEQLPKRKKSALQKMITSVENPAMQISSVLSAASPFIGGAVYAADRTQSNTQFAPLILGCLALSIVSSSITHAVMRKFYSSYKKTVPCPAVLITQGDRDRLSQAERVAEKSNVLMGVLFVGGLLGFVVNIFAAWVFERLF